MQQPGLKLQICYTFLPEPSERPTRSGRGAKVILFDKSKAPRLRELPRKTTAECDLNRFWRLARENPSSVGVKSGRATRLSAPAAGRTRLSFGTFSRPKARSGQDLSWAASAAIRGAVHGSPGVPLWSRVFPPDSWPISA